MIYNIILKKKIICEFGNYDEWEWSGRMSNSGKKRNRRIGKYKYFNRCEVKYWENIQRKIEEKIKKLLATSNFTDC